MKRWYYLVFLWAALSLSPRPVSAEETIKIGFPMPLSGPTAVYGVPITKGAEMAIADINAKGGVLGRKLNEATGKYLLADQISLELGKDPGSRPARYRRRLGRARSPLVAR